MELAEKKKTRRKTQNKKRQRVRWFANFKGKGGIGKKNEGWVWYWQIREEKFTRNQFRCWWIKGYEKIRNVKVLKWIDWTTK